MKLKYLSIIAVAMLSLFTTTACMDSHDEPPVTITDNDDNINNDFGEPNATILDIKAKYCKSADGAGYSRNSSNWYTEIKDDIVIEGVVCANDISGNLYQTLLIRNIDKTKDASDPARDQSIILSLRSTALYTYFKLGQRIKINLKGLYVGVYSKTPRIGMPYRTSRDNINLGPIIFETFMANNLEVVGEPDTYAPELTPIDKTDDAGKAWLRATANRTYENSPMLATVRGDIKEASEANRNVLSKGTQEDVLDMEETLSANGKKIFGPYELHDPGFGVDRTLELGNGSSVTIRTSTKNRVSFVELPENTRSYTGILSYYDTWQLQLRDTDDISAN